MKVIAIKLLLFILLIVIIRIGPTSSFYSDSESINGNTMTSGYWITPEVTLNITFNEIVITDNIEPTVTATPTPEIFENIISPTPTIDINFSSETGFD